MCLSWQETGIFFSHDLWTNVDETYYVASYGENKIVYAKTAFFQCSPWQQTSIGLLFSHVNQME
jgi:hypothetical protein